VTLDKTSLLVSCSVDEGVAALEKRLHREGFTLGYRPVSAKTVRQALERRAPNRDALRYGEIDDLCVSVQALRKGETLITRNVPRSATGPDFKKILIGSGRRYAKLVRAVLKIHPLPEKRETLRVSWGKKGGRDAFLRSFWASGVRPVRFRASRLAATVTLEGSKGMVAAEKKCVERLARQTQGRVTS